MFVCRTITHTGRTEARINASWTRHLNMYVLLTDLPSDALTCRTRTGASKTLRQNHNAHNTHKPQSAYMRSPSTCSFAGPQRTQDPWTKENTHTHWPRTQHTQTASVCNVDKLSVLPTHTTHKHRIYMQCRPTFGQMRLPTGRMQEQKTQTQNNHARNTHTNHRTKSPI